MRAAWYAATPMIRALWLFFMVPGIIVGVISVVHPLPDTGMWGGVPLALAAGTYVNRHSADRVDTGAARKDAANTRAVATVVATVLVIGGTAVTIISGNPGWAIAGVPLGIILGLPPFLARPDG
jgi:hypothetical protein